MSEKRIEAIAQNGNDGLHYAIEKQVGGSHYDMPIQPVEYVVKNGIGYLEGNVIKYVTRHKNKNGAEDILKAMHYLELILQFEYGEGA